MASLGVGFEPKCARNSGVFSRAKTLEKKFAASLAVGAVHREPFSTVIPC
jgi:hypothetical protein